MIRHLVIICLIYSTPLLAIRSGNIVDRKKYQNIVRILIKDNTCVGIRIAPQSVLTVAHCFREKSSNIRVNVYKNRYVGKWYNVTRENITILSHDTFKEIAILHVPFSTKFRPTFKITEMNYNEINIGDEFNILGYGVNVKSDNTRTLRKGKVMFNQLYEFYPTPMLLVNSGKGYQLPCPGDSGGPLYIRKDGSNELVGLVSFISSSKVHLKKIDKYVDQCRAAEFAAYIPIGMFIDEYQHLLK